MILLVPKSGTPYITLTRVIARSALIRFSREHPGAATALDRWHEIAKAAEWRTTAEIQASFRTAKVLNSQRVRFEIAGGVYRLIVAFDFGRSIAFIKFVGTHAEYDRVDALSISLF